MQSVTHSTFCSMHLGILQNVAPLWGPTGSFGCSHLGSRKSSDAGGAAKDQRGVSRRVCNPCFLLVVGRSRLTFVSLNDITNRPHEREKRKRGPAVGLVSYEPDAAIARSGCAKSRFDIGVGR